MSPITSLFAVEWKKIARYRTFWIFLALVGIAIPGTLFLVRSLANELFRGNQTGAASGLLFNNMKDLLFSFPLIWKTGTFLSGLMLFLPAMLVITNFCNEFQFRTHRQNIMDGWSRGTFFMAKWTFIVQVTLITTLITALSITLTGMFSPLANLPLSMFNQYSPILFFFLVTFHYLSFAGVLSFLFKRSGITIAIFFVYSMIVEQILVQVCRAWDIYAADYLPLEASDRLLTFPLPSLTSIASEFGSLPESWVPHLIVTCLYSGLMIGLTRWRFVRGDL